ncbi:hypothetical protein L2E82_19960 [Cichorium intybus]|uniref:Uncharacterized protein n=1 Tax=Cichorium intybus TaxID=13427 RepID=A0ACB9DT07_CICIN|nr:hypothetical protein L2E82_19960 [Cichorium intybus]
MGVTLLCARSALFWEIEECVALANVSVMGMDTGANSTWPTDSSSVIHDDGLLVKCAVREDSRGPKIIMSSS